MFHCASSGVKGTTCAVEKLVVSSGVATGASAPEFVAIVPSSLKSPSVSPKK
jgi:hypothetical protein